MLNLFFSTSTILLDFVPAPYQLSKSSIISPTLSGSTSFPYPDNSIATDVGPHPEVAIVPSQ